MFFMSSQYEVLENKKNKKQKIFSLPLYNIVVENFYNFFIKEKSIALNSLFLKMRTINSSLLSSYSPRIVNCCKFPYKYVNDTGE